MRLEDLLDQDEERLNRVHYQTGKSLNPDLDRKTELEMERAFENDLNLFTEDERLGREIVDAISLLIDYKIKQALEKLKR